MQNGRQKVIMKAVRPALAFAAFIIAGAGDATAHAPGGWHGHEYWHGHPQGHVELFIGTPAVGSWHYAYPYVYPYAYPYYYRQPPVVVVPPVATVPSSPPVFIEQGSSEQPTPQQTPNDWWWYYCPTERNYYPYVRTCPQGWELVAPRPPDLSSDDLR